MRSSQIFSAILSASTLLASLPVHARAPATPAPAADDDKEAKLLFNARKYPEAAVAFEQLYAAAPVPKHLFNAAMARELAGHEAHAYLLLRRYLVIPDLQPAEVTRARDRLAALQRRTASVRIFTLPDTLRSHNLQVTIERTPNGAIGDAGRVPLVLAGDLLPIVGSADLLGAFDIHLEQGPWVVTASADGHETVRQDVAVDNQQAQLSLTLPELPPPAVAVSATFGPPDALARGLEVTLTRDGDPPRSETVPSGAITWQLTPGTYHYIARAPGYITRQGSFAIADQPVTFPVVDLEPEPTQLPPQQKTAPKPSSTAWVAGLGAAGSASFILGAVLLGVSSSRWNTTLGRYGEYAGNDPTNWNVASTNLFKSWTTYGAGAGLLGGGLGLGLGALGMHFAPRMKQPKRLWAIGAGLGGALVITGALLVGRSGIGVQNPQWAHAADFANQGTTAPDAFSGRQHHIGISAALVGLGAGLAVSSILGLVRPTAAKKTTVLPTGTGLVLTGRF